MARVVLVQSPVAALALLVLGDALEQMMTTEIRPERGRDVNLGVCQLPQQEVAEPHFAAGADDEIGIGKMAGVEVLRDCIFVNLEVLNAAVIHRRGR